MMICDENASVAGRTVLHRTVLEEEFLGFPLDGESGWLGRIRQSWSSRN